METDQGKPEPGRGHCPGRRLRRLLAGGGQRRRQLGIAAGLRGLGPHRSGRPAAGLRLVRLVFLPRIAERINEGQVSAGAVVGGLSVAVGLLNAACITY
ncbi:DUF350 domain-containing protein [Oceanisphaera psychrotolerans]|uniref:DUF350 domain-containing protein n=1 Tax=Oceanisphaera psychrotolerans TaxID=1414654 RepID=UPI003CCBB1F2